MIPAGKIPMTKAQAQRMSNANYLSAVERDGRWLRNVVTGHGRG